MTRTEIQQIGTSRRRFLALVGGAAGATLLLNHSLSAAEEGVVPTMINAAANSKITVRPLRRNISVMEGSGGTIAVLTGKDGKLLVDTGLSVSRHGIADALASINSEPIKHLVNTHWHIDHTDGNDWLHSAGATITAHENVRKRLSVDTRVEGWNWTFPAAPAGALPAIEFGSSHEMQRNNTKLILKYYGPAHTDSDISVHFTEADVIHVGDTWWNGDYPFIDYSTGGSIDGQIQAAEANLRLITDKMIVIPGHGPVGRRPDVIAFRDMLVTVRESVAKLKKQGRTLEQTVAAKPTSAFDAKWGQFLVNPASFVAVVYAGV